MDAKVYGALTKPQKISNDFGVSGGGPVRVPWLYNGKDKTFFFGAYEGLRFPRGQTIQNTAPTQAMRNGDFSGLANVTVRDPLTGAAFQGNRIPDNRISSISKQILSLYPLPNVSNPDQFRVANYIRNASNNINSDQYDIRVDHYLTGKQSVFARLTWKDISTDSPNILSLPSNTAFDRYKILVASHNYTITSRLLNEARFGMTLNDSGASFPFDGRDFTNKLGFVGIGPNFPFNGLPNIDFSGDITDLSRNRADGLNQSRTLQFNNNLTWTQGSHTMKYGIDLRWIRAVSPLGFIGADNYGNSSFNNTFSGYDFGDFLLGIPIRTSFAIIQQDNDGRTTHYHFFGQDSFRVNQRLTLEFGLRYEFHPAYTDAGGNIGNFDTSVPKSGRVVYPTGKRNLLAPGFLATFNACPAPAANGAPCTPVQSAEEAGLPEGLRTVPKYRFLPRFGFAFRPFSNDKTVVRGGIGAYNGTWLIRLAAALACRATSIQTASATATFRTRRPICGLT